MTQPDAYDPSQLDTLIKGLAEYMLACQTEDGPPGAFWSELAYHIPHLDYRGGGSHHNRTVGSAAVTLLRLDEDLPGQSVAARAESAFDWIVTQQHEDGGMFEITNNNKPSQFHLDYERSGISLGMVCHGLYASLQIGLPRKDEYIHFLRQAARWMLTVETDPGNFLHTEGYPPEKLILNASAHAAETMLVGAAVSDDPEEAEVFRSAAVRAITATMACQRDNGMLPYSRRENDNSISYTATVAWIFQNLIDADLMPEELREMVEAGLVRAAAFLASNVREDGSIDWDTWENHGQKYHSWVYGMVARAIAWYPDEELRDCARSLISFLYRELYGPEAELVRLFDFPVGEERVICGQTILSEDFHRCAYHQADLFECLVDTRELLRAD